MAKMTDEDIEKTVKEVDDLINRVNGKLDEICSSGCKVEVNIHNRMVIGQREPTPYIHITAWMPVRQ